MKHEDQVSSLEYSEQLKALGVKQESLWYWVGYPELGVEPSLREISDHHSVTNLLSAGRTVVSAFTVEELGEVLPKGMHSYKRDDGFACLSEHQFGETILEVANTEANARAKARIWLIENKHIEV